MRATDPLRADCARCFALCCIALPFTASADFAVDKPGGIACRHLQRDDRCGIHAQLRERGFAGCTAFDCFGAGQQISQHTFAGRDWRTHPDVAAPMFDAFAVVRQLHEMRWHLRQARALVDHPGLDALSDRILIHAAGSTDQLTRLDVAALRVDVARELGRVSLAVRGTAGRDLRGADLIGADLRLRSVAGADLRGAYLIAADLRGLDVGRADLLVQMCDARLGAADLREALFLTQSQLESARGDARTLLPADLRRPLHWLGER